MLLAASALAPCAFSGRNFRPRPRRAIGLNAGAAAVLRSAIFDTSDCSCGPDLIRPLVPGVRSPYPRTAELFQAWRPGWNPEPGRAQVIQPTQATQFWRLVQCADTIVRPSFRRDR